MMNLEWQDIGYDSDTIERIAHNGEDMYIEFKKGSGYKFTSMPYEIFIRILNKEVISKSEGKPSYGATFNMLVVKSGFKGEQYK